MKMSDLKLPEWKVVIQVKPKGGSNQSIQRVLIVQAGNEKVAKRIALSQVKSMDIGFNTYRVIAILPVS